MTFNPQNPFDDENFEFEAVEITDPVDLNERIQKAYKKQMQTVEKLILPVLKNLMKNPENDTIKWPNRTEAIQSQINKITTVTKAKLEY